MKSLNRVFLLLFSMLFATTSSFAQGQDPDFMRSMGKMYVVVAVILAIFIGIVLFLVFLDRRVTKIENQIKD